jgi:hypothetical protein
MNTPRWLEATLCLLLKPEDRESVSGGVREEYRKIVRPAGMLGKSAAGMSGLVRRRV